jgi:U3 small nucleolar RNA-associated protein 18
MTKAKAKKYESPLTMDMTENPEDAENKKKIKREEKKSRKRARREAQEDMEEERLTNLIFGGNDGLGGDAAWNDVDEEGHDDDDFQEQLKPSQEEAEFGFQIDRCGANNESNKRKGDDSDESGSEKGDTSTGDDDVKRLVGGDTPAWVDDEDEAEFSFVESGARLRKLRHFRQESHALTADELERRLRKRYEESTQRSARTDWASTKPSKKYDEDEKNEAAKLFSTSGSLLASSRNRLPPNILKIVRCPDANQSDYSKSVVKAIHFHPGSDPDRPLLLTAGLDKSLRFFQVGADRSEKIHGIHCKYMFGKLLNMIQIHCTLFLLITYTSF